MSIEDKDELAREFSESGYRDTSDPDVADRRNYYTVELWDTTESHIKALVHASNDLTNASAIFTTQKMRRPRGHTRFVKASVCWTAGRPMRTDHHHRMAALRTSVAESA